MEKITVEQSVDTKTNLLTLKFSCGKTVVPITNIDMSHGSEDLAKLIEFALDVIRIKNDEKNKAI